MLAGKGRNTLRTLKPNGHVREFYPRISTQNLTSGYRSSHSALDLLYVGFTRAH